MAGKTIQDLEIPGNDVNLLIEKSDLEALEKGILEAINKTLPPVQAFKSSIEAIQCFEAGDYLTSNKALQTEMKILINSWPGMSGEQANQFYQIHMGRVESESESLKKIYAMIKDYRDRERRLRLRIEAVEAVPQVGQCAKQGNVPEEPEINELMKDLKTSYPKFTLQ